jgi:hypothetical protein
LSKTIRKKKSSKAEVFFLSKIRFHFNAISSFDPAVCSGARALSLFMVPCYDLYGSLVPDFCKYLGDKVQPRAEV